MKKIFNNNGCEPGRTGSEGTLVCFEHTISSWSYSHSWSQGKHNLLKTYDKTIDPLINNQGFLIGRNNIFSKQVGLTINFPSCFTTKGVARVEYLLQYPCNR